MRVRSGQPVGRVMGQKFSERRRPVRVEGLRQHHCPPFCTKLRTNSSAFSSSTSSMSSRIVSTSSSSFSLRSATSSLGSTWGSSSVSLLLRGCLCCCPPSRATSILLACGSSVGRDDADVMNPSPHRRQMVAGAGSTRRERLEQFEGGLRLIQQLTDMFSRTPQRFHGGHPLQRVASG